MTSAELNVTIEECRAVIEKKFKSNSYKIVDHNLSCLDERCGFLGEHFRLLITVTDENEEIANVYCFAKFLPLNPAQAEFTITTGAFKKEVFMYDDLFFRIQEAGINCLKSCIPECYLTKTNYILVFEDVTKRDFKPLSKYGYIDYDHVLVILKAIAKLHASGLIFEEKMSEKYNNKYRLLDEYLDYFHETFYVNKPDHKGGQGVFAAIKGLYTGYDMFPVENPKISDQQLKNITKKICLDIFELVKPSAKYRNVICHGDLWSTNIMMKYENEKPFECLILDFQTARYCPPSHDFMSFIHLTTTREFRKQHLRNLQIFYYNELDLLVKSYGYDLSGLIPFDEFLKSCEEQKSFAIVQTVTYVQLTQVKDESVKEFAQDTAKWDEALYTDRSTMVTENCEKDPEYKHVFKEALTDLRELCEDNAMC